MKRKGSLELIKTIESLVRNNCDYIVTKDASKNGHMPLKGCKEFVDGVYSKEYVIHSRQCLIVLRLEFEPRDNIGRLYLRNDHVGILCNTVPGFRYKLEELRKEYLEQGGNNGITNNAVGNRRHSDTSFKGKHIPQIS